MVGVGVVGSKQATLAVRGLREERRFSRRQGEERLSNESFTRCYASIRMPKPFRVANHIACPAPH